MKKLTRIMVMPRDSSASTENFRGLGWVARKRRRGSFGVLGDGELLNCDVAEIDRPVMLIVRNVGKQARTFTCHLLGERVF